MRGQRFADRFYVEAETGAGGMGTVYRARDTHTGELVALKVLTEADSHEILDRFRREASLLAKLDHPRFVRYLGHGEPAGLPPYLVMEWVRGESLASRLRRGKLGAAAAIATARAIAEGLAAAHALDIVHRDIKPSNLFIRDDDGEVKILDLGVARFVGDRQLTRTGSLVGTPGYMSPEQARGSTDIDASTDVFALGCVLYEMLAGRPAFEGEEVMAVLVKILLEPAAGLDDPPASWPEGLVELLQRMLHKDRSERLRDGAAVVAALDRVAASVDPAEADTLPRGRRGITGEERQLLSVVLVGGTELDAAAATTVAMAPNALGMTAIGRTVAEHGARAYELATGAVVIALHARGAATDLAARAVRCALSVRRALPEAPIAVATGRGRLDDSSASGEVIDQVARLLRAAEKAPAGKGLRIDETTFGLLGSQFSIKGDDSGLFVVGAREEEVAARMLLGKPSPCVGRDKELLLLEAAYADCAAEHVPQAVVVTGPPGIGKSRLRYEFVDRLIARDDPPEVWMARGEQLSSGAPLGLLAQAIRRTCGVIENEPQAVQRRRLRARVGRHLGDAERERVVQFVGELAGVEFEAAPGSALAAARDNPMSMAPQLRRAWLDWLRAECAARPIILVLEDMHWGDRPTVDFVDEALAALGEYPFLVIALGRPELDTTFPGLWSERTVTRVQLRELSRRAAVRLVGDVLGAAVPPEVVDDIVERAAGNAFYLEELMRAVAEGGRTAGLPSTVLAMLHARLEALPPEARTVLRAGSVFGQVFWKGGVRALLAQSWEEGKLDDWIAFVASKEIISRRVESTLVGEEELVFRHALVADAAHEMLIDADRGLAHRLAAHWLETAGATDPLALARHYELGGEPRKAARWFLRAGERLVAEGAAEAALGNLAHAEELGLPVRSTLTLASHVHQAYRLLGDHEGALRWAEARLETVTEPAARAALLDVVVEALRHLDCQAALARTDEALAVADEVGNVEIYAHILSNASYAAYRLRDLEAAERFARAAILHERLTPRAEIQALRARMFLASALGKHDEALDLCRLVRDKALTLGDLAAAAAESKNLAEALLERDQAAAAAEEAERAATLAESAGYRALIPGTRALWARALVRLGRAVAARELFDQAMQALGGAETGTLDRLMAAAAEVLPPDDPAWAALRRS